MDIYEICKKALDDIFYKQGFVNLIINKYIKEVVKKDQPLFTKIVYGVVDNRLLIDYNINLYLTKEIKNRDVNIYLEIASFTMKFLNLTDALVVNEIVEKIKAVDYHLAGLANAILKKISKAKLLIPDDTINHQLSIKYSYPEKLVDFLRRLYPDAIEDILKHPENSYNTYFINTLKPFNLNDLKIKYELIDGLIVTKENLNNTAFVKGGYLINQNLSSAKVAKMIEVKSGMSVLDMCSAPGTKAMNLAIKCHNDLSLTCLDLHPHKVELIKKDALLLGVKIKEAKAIDATMYEACEQFDVVMLDAPCSGLGVMKHKVDLKYHFSFNKLNELYVLQKALLGKAYQLAKAGGAIIYSTCTINSLENEEMIKYFLKKHKDLKVIKEEKIMPDDLMMVFIFVI